LSGNIHDYVLSKGEDSNAKLLMSTWVDIRWKFSVHWPQSASAPAEPLVAISFSP
jgi:hypothetical protein